MSDQHIDHHTHSHTHGHAGDHSHDHDHAHGATSERMLIWAIALTAMFMVVEFAAGLMAQSLALVADAGHMLTDTAALTLALAALRAVHEDWLPRFMA